MVGQPHSTFSSWLMADVAQPAAETGAKALAALAGLISLGVAMLLLTWLGARVVRRRMNPPHHKPDRSKFAEFGVDDWAKKPGATDTKNVDESNE